MGGGLSERLRRLLTFSSRWALLCMIAGGASLWLLFVLPHALLVDVCLDKLSYLLPQRLSQWLSAHRFKLAQAWALTAMCFLVLPGYNFTVDQTIRVETATAGRLVRSIVVYVGCAASASLTLMSRLLTLVSTNSLALYLSILWTVVICARPP